MDEFNRTAEKKIVAALRGKGRKTEQRYPHPRILPVVCMKELVWIDTRDLKSDKYDFTVKDYVEIRRGGVVYEIAYTIITTPKAGVDGETTEVRHVHSLSKERAAAA